VETSKHKIASLAQLTCKIQVKNGQLLEVEVADLGHKVMPCAEYKCTGLWFRTHPEAEQPGARGDQKGQLLIAGPRAGAALAGIVSGGKLFLILFAGEKE
jgi:hypothetical protein